jgi:hypothetical protein
MGHTYTRLTEWVYTDVFAEAKQGAMGKFGSVLAGA